MWGVGGWWGATATGGALIGPLPAAPSPSLTHSEDRASPSIVRGGTSRPQSCGINIGNLFFFWQGESFFSPLEQGKKKAPQRSSESWKHLQASLLPLVSERLSREPALSGAAICWRLAKKKGNLPTTPLKLVGKEQRRGKKKITHATRQNP